jgi:hypothetical protein
MAAATSSGTALADQAEGEHQHDGHRKEERRRDDLEAAGLDHEVLSHHQPRDPEEAGHAEAMAER